MNFMIDGKNVAPMVLGVSVIFSVTKISALWALKLKLDSRHFDVASYFCNINIQQLILKLPRPAYFMNKLKLFYHRRRNNKRIKIFLSHTSV